ALVSTLCSLAHIVLSSRPRRTRRLCLPPQAARPESTRQQIRAGTKSMQESFRPLRGSHTMTFVDLGAIGECDAAARRRATQPSLCENLLTAATSGAAGEPADAACRCCGHQGNARLIGEDDDAGLECLCRDELEGRACALAEQRRSATDEERMNPFVRG